MHWNFFIDFLEHYAQTVITKLKKDHFEHHTVNEESGAGMKKQKKYRF